MELRGPAPTVRACSAMCELFGPLQNWGYGIVTRSGCCAAWSQMLPAVTHGPRVAHAYTTSAFLGLHLLAGSPVE